MGNDKLYDVIIVGGGAAGLFCSIFANSKLNKLILEKSDRIGSKVLLSGGGRCNVTNANLNPNNDYLGDNVQVLHGIFHKFGNNDMINWLEEKGLTTHEEERGKILLDCEKSSKLLEVLINESNINNTEIKTGEEVLNIEKINDYFVIKTINGKYLCKKLIIASGGKTFPQIGASGFARSLADKIGIQTNEAYPCLCGIQTKQDLSGITGNSTNVELVVSDGKKIIYKSKGQLLFTHRGISGPVVFDATLYVGKKLVNLSDGEIKLIFGVHSLTKKIANFFGLDKNKNEVELNMIGFRPWEEAKVTGGGIKLLELNQNLESRKLPGLYFIGESCDITGRTGGFNLQWAWSSGYVVGKAL